MKICPHCQNRFDTCGVCHGTGYVPDNYIYTERPVKPRPESEAQQRTWCFPFFHQWGKWTVIGEGSIRRDSLGGKTVGSFIDQKRVCGRCGKTQLDVQRTYV